MIFYQKRGRTLSVLSILATIVIYICIFASGAFSSGLDTGTDADTNIIDLNEAATQLVDDTVLLAESR